MDAYLRAALVEAYVATLVSLLSLFILFDLLYNAARYVTNAEQGTAGTVDLVVQLARYYGMLLPSMFIGFAPYATVIACMFGVTKLMSQNEVTPMLFAGRSLYRILRPTLMVAVWSALAMAATWELVVPRFAEPLHRLSALLQEGRARVQQEDIVMRVGEDQRNILYCPVYLHDEKRIEGVTVVDRGSFDGDVSVLRATAATWNPARRGWDLEGGELRVGQRIVPQPFLALAEAEPDLLWRMARGEREGTQLSYSELLDLQRLRPGRHDFVVHFHGHVTFPLANVVLLLLALPFAVHFERGRRLERIVYAIMICAAYMIAELICRNLGLRQFLDPVVAAWTPTVVFGSLGVVFFFGMRT
jgi:lipopolysaccharide export system permease protein